MSIWERLHMRALKAFKAGDFALSANLWDAALKEMMMSGVPQSRHIPLLEAQGQAFLQQQKFFEALNVLTRCLSLKVETFGSDHYETALCCEKLAGAYFCVGKFREAQSLGQRALTIYVQQCHPDVERMCVNLAALYEAMGDRVAADRLLARSSKFREALNLLGPSIASTLRIEALAPIAISAAPPESDKQPIAETKALPKLKKFVSKPF